jgi:hypothetical protein
MGKQLKNQGAGRNPSGSPSKLTNAPNPGATFSTPAPKYPGVNHPISKDPFTGETGKVRRPNPAPPNATSGKVVTSGNPFVDSTDDAGDETTVKAPQGQPYNKAGSSEIGNDAAKSIGEAGNYVNQQLAVRPGMQRPAQPAADGCIPGGGFSGPNKGTGGMHDANNGSDSGRPSAQPGATIGKTLAKKRSPMNDF